jgi:hypothetical protein
MKDINLQVNSEYGYPLQILFQESPHLLRVG